MTRPGAAYVMAVGLGGLALFAFCAVALVQSGIIRHSQWLLFAVLTFASGRVTLKVPGVAARFSLAEIFAFASVLLFGPEAGAVVLALDSLVVSWHHRMTRTQTLFNFGNLALSVWTSGFLFFLAAGTRPLVHGLVSTESLVGPLAVMTAAYFALNSGLVAAAIAFQTTERPFEVWKSHFLSLWPGYAVAASAALLLVSALRQVDVSGLALLLPVIIVSYLMLRSTFGRLEDSRQHATALNRLYLSTIETLATAIDAKDDVTHNHIRRVQAGALALTRHLGLTDPQLVKAIEAAALLHDTGKIAVPEHILNKPGKLTPAEFEKMKLHAPIGAEILAAIDFPYPVVPIVRHHHENWDGTGYPDGLRGDEIPIGARILAVVDCYDALTSDRPYRKRMSDEAAIAILLERRGNMYDPAVVDAFLQSYKEIMPAGVDTVHPAARAVGAARAMCPAEPPADTEVPRETPALEGIGAFASLARSVAGEAGLSDVGSLIWLLVRQVVPCTAMALFMPDERADALVARYAAGSHAAALRKSRYAMAQGTVGWTAVNRRMILNGDATIGCEALSGIASLHVCTLPLVHDGALVAVLAVYAEQRTPFTEPQAQLIELVGPRLAATIAALAVHHAAADPVEALPHRPDIRVLRRA